MFKRPSRLHWSLLLCVLCLCALSVYNLKGTRGPHIKDMHLQQLKWLLISAPILSNASLVNFHLLRKIPIPIYLAFNGLLVSDLLFGKVVNGSRRWIDLGAFNLQPSELAKLGLIVSLAAWFQRFPKPMYVFQDMCVLALIIGLPMTLVFLEPDLGHTLMLMLIALSMFSIERFHMKTVLVIIATVFMASPLIWTYVLKR